MEIVYKKLKDIKPYENNPRNNEQAIDYVANSIKEFGFNVPLVIDKNGIIITGHTRYLASIKLGLKEIPCIIADDLSEEKVNAFRLADNKVAESSRWDYKKLTEELRNVDEEMMDFFDLDFIELSMDEDVKESDSESEEKEEKESFYKCPNCERNVPESELIVCK